MSGKNPVCFKKVGWVFFFAAVVVFASWVFSRAQDSSGSDQGILLKLERIIDSQARLEDLLNTIINNQAEIKQELQVIKIRATVH
ncbi:MAG: hypothetical protein ACOY3D_00960 [Candidatus Omnitrophota bacterium]